MNGPDRAIILTFWQRIENTALDGLSRDRLSRVAAAERVLQHLHAHGVKPKDLQKALEISASMASRILDGSRGISTWHLDAIADLLGLTVPQLFSDISERSTTHELPTHATMPPSDSPSKGASHDSSPIALAADIITLVEHLQEVAAQLVEHAANDSLHTASREDRPSPPRRLRRRRLAG